MNQTKYGRLSILSEIEKKPCVLRSGRVIYARQMRCLCECGNVKDIVLSSLRKGATKSCGCLKKEVDGTIQLTHGMTNTREYGIWSAMKRRCYNKNCRDYKDYGGRGISVCQEWIDSFEAFYRDMGPRPSARHSIDRIDPEGDYAKQNCRWASPILQASNKRNIRPIEAYGEAQTLIEWARRLGIPKTTLQRYVANGLSIEEAADKFSRRHS